MLKNLLLENFRNHARYELALEQTTILVGQNGVGKSNILEAISLLSFCRSYREDEKANLINYGSGYARVTGDDLEVFIQKTPKILMRAKQNGAPRKLTDFIGLLPAVILTPESLTIITGSPQERRRFLDAMISQVDRSYLLALIAYNKIRAQRNRLLQRIFERQAEAAELNYWDKELVSYGTIIRDQRSAAVEHFNTILSKTYQQISADEKSELVIRYQHNPGDMQELLKAKRSQEIAAGKTLVGPHRDDLLIELGSRQMANYASRGEIKSAILAMKLAELEYLKQRHPGCRDNKEICQPIFLLDDIFSEFDAKRREQLSNLLLPYQTVITAAGREYLHGGLMEKAKVVEL